MHFDVDEKGDVDPTKPKVPEDMTKVLELRALQTGMESQAEQMLEIADLFDKGAAVFIYDDGRGEGEA